MKRILDLEKLLENKSFFLFGPRASGKTWLIREQIATNSLVINLLETDTYTRFLAHPENLRAVCASIENGKYVVIDEIQKVPALLDEVHLLIEEKGLRFLLTGSSARKLKKDGVNLLAGRAWKSELFPLTSKELGESFDLNRFLLYGGLPPVYLSQSPQEELFSYVDTYLREEILQEALVRNLPAFSRFLKVVSICDGQIVNYTEIGNDSQVSPSTVREYFHLLEDTLLGFTIEPWKASRHRKAVQTAKFFLFDTGVSNTLREVESIPRNSELYGLRFEQFIAMELRAFLSYQRKRKKLNFWRTHNGQEVDFLIGEEVAIEVKSTEKVGRKHIKGLLALKEEEVFQKYFLVSNDKLELERDGIMHIYWKNFLQKLWQGEIL